MLLIRTACAEVAVIENCPSGGMLLAIGHEHLKGLAPASGEGSATPMTYAPLQVLKMRLTS